MPDGAWVSIDRYGTMTPRIKPFDFNAPLDAPELASDVMTTTADLLLRGGQLIDGTGAPAIAADVAVSDRRILAVGAAAEPVSDRLRRAEQTVRAGEIQERLVERQRLQRATA